MSIISIISNNNRDINSNNNTIDSSITRDNTVRNKKENSIRSTQY